MAALPWKCWTRWLPIKPQPPVMRTFMIGVGASVRGTSTQLYEMLAGELFYKMFHLEEQERG
jgi:hypothetical protein